ncbi:hypothetical protein EVAR_62695_1 [Eumeta japonica]|uniref:Uncharacterized protein n=1 Tax=Eumeta variegata TaxID=151549 RepID=A0A4C1ZLZ6_EUMVA|nr:hypothetical protein EVAR_62695_1 [Eumeta japonica]
MDSFHTEGKCLAENKLVKCDMIVSESSNGSFPFSIFSIPSRLDALFSSIKPAAHWGLLRGFQYTWPAVTIYSLMVRKNAHDGLRKVCNGNFNYGRVSPHFEFLSQSLRRTDFLRGVGKMMDSAFSQSDFFITAELYMWRAEYN